MPNRPDDHDGPPAAIARAFAVFHDLTSPPAPGPATAKSPLMAKTLPTCQPTKSYAWAWHNHQRVAAFFRA